MTSTPRRAGSLDILAVIPARDTAGDIGPCVDALMAAGLAADRIVVVDDGSIDATGSIAAGRGVVLMHGGGAGAASARNKGATHPAGDVLLFVDADVTVHPDAVRRVRERLESDAGLAAIFGAYDREPLHPQAVSRIRNLLNHHVHASNPGEATSFWTGLGAVRRDVFEALGGFDPGQRMMEDIEFGLRLVRAGHRILLDPEIRGSHRKRWTLAGLVRADLWNRAVPWTRLMHSELGRSVPAGLNVSAAGKVSVLAVAATLIALPVFLMAPGPGALLVMAGLGALAVANRGFLSLLARLDGAGRALQGLGVLWVHFLCAGLGYALARTGIARG
ncbi:glycosyltransferase [Jannaschia aquimarina]|nr:glycosyltransferase [Jannaschia aquimarina]